MDINNQRGQGSPIRRRDCDEELTGLWEEDSEGPAMFYLS